MIKQPPNCPDKLKRLVTDHAVIRYIERVHGFDMSDFRREILKDGVYDALKAGATRTKKEGVEFVIKDHKIVTVIGGDA